MGQTLFIPEERMRLGGCGQSLPEGPRGQRAEQVPYTLMDSSLARGSSDLGDRYGTQGTPLLGARVPHPGQGPTGGAEVPLPSAAAPGQREARGTRRIPAAREHRPACGQGARAHGHAGGWRKGGRGRRDNLVRKEVSFC